MPGFNPTSIPYWVRELVSLSDPQKETARTWVSQLREDGSISEADEYFFLRQVDEGFFSAREYGRLWAKVHRGGSRAPFNLFEAIKVKESTKE